MNSEKHSESNALSLGLGGIVFNDKIGAGIGSLRVGILKEMSTKLDILAATFSLTRFSRKHSRV